MPAITVTLPVSVNVTSGDVLLFGQDVTSSDKMVKLDTTVAALDLSGMIQYIQNSADPNDVTLASDVATTSFAPATFVTDLSGALNASVTLDATGTYSWWTNAADSRKTDASSPLFKYDSIYQFLLGWISYQVFSHPLAQAGISNDTSIVSSLGAASVAQTLFNSISTLTNEQLKVVFQEIVKQDATRFNRDDINSTSNPVSHPVGSPQFLQFAAGDKVRFEVHLNSYDVKRANSASAPGSGTASGSATDAGNTLMSGGNDYFTIEVTLA